MNIIKSVRADELYEECAKKPGGNEIDPHRCASPLYELDKIFANIISVVIGLAGLVLFIMLLLGGFSLLTSGGDAAKAASAQKTITHAIIGMVLIAFALLVMRLIEEITGANLTNFSVFLSTNP